MEVFEFLSNIAGSEAVFLVWTLGSFKGIGSLAVFCLSLGLAPFGVSIVSRILRLRVLTVRRASQGSQVQDGYGVLCRGCIMTPTKSSYKVHVLSARVSIRVC